MLKACITGFPSGSAKRIAKINACEVFSVTYRNLARWKWRYIDATGSIRVCAEDYKRFIDCVAAARASGYEPRCDWTAPCASRDERRG